MDNWKSNQITLIALIAGTVIGITAWLPHEAFIWVLLLIPLLLGLLNTKAQYIALVTAYYLASSYGMVQGIAQFPGGSWLLGFSLWALSSIILSIPYLMIWKFKKFGWILTCLILFIPPLGFLNWMSPLLIAGYIFPGFGVLGIILTVIAFIAIQHKPKSSIAFVTICICTHFFVTPNTQKDFVAVNTNFSPLTSQQINFSTDYKNLELILKVASEEPSHFQIFPESSIRHWTSYTGETIRRSLAGTDKTILIGVQYPEHSELGDVSWVNAIAKIDEESQKIVYKQGTPIPYFMWNPWSNGYKRNTSNSILSIKATDVKMLICYEAFTLRSIFTDLYSIKTKPDLFVSIGNYAWARGTNIESIYRKKAKLISRLFMRPFVVSTNS